MKKKLKRGRVKGQGVGCGAIQILVKKNGGKVYLENLYSKIQSADGIADYFFQQFNLYCCANTIRNIMRQYNLKLNPSGGDRRSAGIVKFRTERIEKLANIVRGPYTPSELLNENENIPRRQVC